MMVGVIATLVLASNGAFTLPPSYVRIDTAISYTEKVLGPSAKRKKSKYTISENVQR